MGTKTSRVIPDSLDGNEAGGVGGLKVVQGVHGGLLLGVELLGAGRATEDVDVALVAAETDLTVDALLSLLDAVELNLDLRPLTRWENLRLFSMNSRSGLK